MSAAATRAAIVALLSGIPDIGAVYGYERYARDNKGFLDLYTAAGRIRGWRVSRISERRRVLASGRELVAQRWAIVGLIGLVDADASEIVAGDLADAIVAAERADPTLGGLVRGVPVEGASGMQLLGLEPVMFAGALCHRVTLQLDVESYEAQAAGDLQIVDGAIWRLVGAVVDRLHEQDTAGLFAMIEGRLAWDRDDDPVDFPAAIVVPMADRATPEPETIQARQRVDRSIAVIVTAPAGYSAGAGALAAGGLEVLREAVRTALIGWGDGAGGVVDIPCLYAGGTPADAPAGRIAWRDVYTPAQFVET